MPPHDMNQRLRHTVDPAIRSRSTQEDLDRLCTALNTLQTSGWYHGAMTYKDAKRKLRESDDGTFLIRDSSDANYLFSLSVKTPRGTTSVRIEYDGGKFSLDSEEGLRNSAPSFDCVVKLIHHYIELGKEQDKAMDRNGNNEKRRKGSGQFVWLEPNGRKDTEARIRKPMRSGVRSLQHLCRCTINKNMGPNPVFALNLPGKLKSYLMEYPFYQ